MIGKKDGFQGERTVILPPVIVEMEEQDLICKGLFITDIGYYPKAQHHRRVREKGVNQYVYKMEKTQRYKVVYTFGWYLRKFIEDVREKGGTPILLSRTFPATTTASTSTARRSSTARSPCA